MARLNAVAIVVGSALCVLALALVDIRLGIFVLGAGLIASASERLA